MKAILIITCEGDRHVPTVEEHLKKQGVRCYTLATEGFLKTGITISPTEREGIIRLHDTTLRLADIGAVWYRKPEPVNVAHFQPRLTDDELDFVQAEAQEALDGLYALLGDRFWLTTPPLKRSAARKLLQLAVAREVGFKVPRTIFTNDPDRAMQFASAVGWELAIKAMSWASVMKPDGEAITQYGIYTRKLTEEEARAGLHLVKHSPAMLQEYVPKRADLRVVCVGPDHLFPIEIMSQNGSFSNEDCRFHIRDLPHQLVDRPSLIGPIRRYMDRMDMHFACFDFAVSQETGEDVFLEANPNGQWAWLEKDTGALISQAIADVLVSHVA